MLTVSPCAMVAKCIVHVGPTQRAAPCKAAEIFVTGSGEGAVTAPPLEHATKNTVARIPGELWRRISVGPSIRVNGDAARAALHDASGAQGIVEPRAARWIAPDDR